MSITLRLDPTSPGKHLDLTSFSLSHGGISPFPEFNEHLQHLRQLKPKIIRFFMLDYYDTFPAKGVYDWTKLDHMLSAIVATGARPLPCICYKPRWLFPEINDKIIHPTSYADWEQLIVDLVKHCKEKNFGIEYWEIGNEGDFGEQGGCPYRFTAENYPVYYTHTVCAILRADPAARVGGPALADYRGPMTDAIIEHCGKGHAPMHFFSWHMYADQPNHFGESIKAIKAKLAKYPDLKDAETMISEWNMDFLHPNMDPWFQPCHLLETTRIFAEAGLTMSAFYQIRDSYYDSADFTGINSPKWFACIDGYFNTESYLGIYDNQGRVRPAYFVFKCMSRMVGTQLEVSGAEGTAIKALAVRDQVGIKALVWNFPNDGTGAASACDLDIGAAKDGLFRLNRIDPEVSFNNVAYVRSGTVQDLKSKPLAFTVKPYEIYWLEIIFMDNVVNPNFGAPEDISPVPPTGSTAP